MLEERIDEKVTIKHETYEGNTQLPEKEKVYSLHVVQKA